MEIEVEDERCVSKCDSRGMYVGRISIYRILKCTILLLQINDLTQAIKKGSTTGLSSCTDWCRQD